MNPVARDFRDNDDRHGSPVTNTADGKRVVNELDFFSNKTGAANLIKDIQSFHVKEESSRSDEMIQGFQLDVNVFNKEYLKIHYFFSFFYSFN